MRLRYFLLAAGIGLLATSEAFLIEPDTSSKISSNIIDSNRNYEYNNRFLRTGKVTNAGTVKNDEERAISSIQGFLLDKTATKAWLKFFLERGLSVQQVKEQYLAMPSHLSFNQMLEHINWNALVKYQRMKWEHSNGKKVPYAYFGSGYQTEEKTKEMLLAWIVADNSVEKVGKYLGVWGLPKNEQVVHQNWRAFKTYSKWFAEYKQGMKKWQYADFGTGIQSEKKTKEVLTQWAMAGTPLEDVMKSLKLAGLSGSKLENHQNYDALLTYIKYFRELAPIRTANALARARARARASAKVIPISA